MSRILAAILADGLLISEYVATLHQEVARANLYKVYEQCFKKNPDSTLLI